MVGAGLAVAALVKSRNKANGGGSLVRSRAMLNHAGQIGEHMEVIGSDNQHVGTVDKVAGDQIKLTRKDQAANGKHHLISLDLVDSVEFNQVRLNQTADETRANWQES